MDVSITGLRGTYRFFVSFQYVCCLKYDQQKERTLHIITHLFGDLTLEELLQKIDTFASEETNLKWISQVGASNLEKFSMTAEEYVHDLVQGTVNLDELSILIACRVLSIHCLLLLSERYWSSRSDGLYNNCELKLAFTGNYGFKQITSKVSEEIDDFNEDLDGTGILDEDRQNEMDSEDHPDSVCDKCEGSCACSDPSDQSESLDSSDSDSDLIVLSSTEENIAASPHETSILSLVKTEPSK